ncbi:MAG: GNAT family N-acetyltransferase, partial [Gemmatimonadaceae bacterium]
MRYSIRPARPHDRDAVLALTPRLEAFGPPANVVPGQVGQGEARALGSVFARMPEGAALLIAESDDGTIVGFVFLETKIDYFTQRPHGHVGVLVVAAQAEGQGLGKALLDTADAWALALGYDRLTLFVFEGNSRARSAYERAGYRADLVRYRRDLVPTRPLATARLTLVPATEVIARADLAGRDQLQRELDVVVPDEWPPELFDHAAIEHSIEMIRNPIHRPWGYFYVTTREEPRTVVAIVGYKGAPDENATVEIGYGTLPSHRRKGFATEASRALIDRAFDVPSVRRVIAETLPDLTPSIGVMEKLGFQFVGEGSEPGVIRYELLRSS